MNFATIAHDIHRTVRGSSVKRLSMASARRFRIDVAIHNVLMRSNPLPTPPQPIGATLPQPIFPQYPEKLKNAGPEIVPERRDWSRKHIYRTMRGWLFLYIRSRVMPSEFHPITAYLFVECKCNLDCWYCWAFNNKVKGMSEDVARRSKDWLHDHGCRVLAFMGGEPLLRPQIAHKIVHYAAEKGFWIYIGTNDVCCGPRWPIDCWMPVPLCSASPLTLGMRKQVSPRHSFAGSAISGTFCATQDVYASMVLFNMNVCRNNLDDIRMLTEYAREHRIATDYHINETPMIEQDEHFKHMNDNPTYIRPEDWRAVDALIDGLSRRIRPATRWSTPSSACRR